MAMNDLYFFYIKTTNKSNSTFMKTHYVISPVLGADRKVEEKISCLLSTEYGEIRE